MIKLKCPHCGQIGSLDAEVESYFLVGDNLWCGNCVEPRAKAAGVPPGCPPSEIDHVALGMSPLELTDEPTAKELANQ